MAKPSPHLPVKKMNPDFEENLAGIDEDIAEQLVAIRQHGELIKMPAGLTYSQVANPTGIRELMPDSPVYESILDNLAEYHGGLCLEYLSLLADLDRRRVVLGKKRLNLGKYNQRRFSQADVELVSHQYGDSMWLKVVADQVLPFHQKSIRFGRVALLFGTIDGMPWRLRYRGEVLATEARIGARPLQPDQVAATVRFMKRAQARLTAQ